MITLTAHLLSLLTNPSYTAVTTHPFLFFAGSGTLPASRLALYLSQDRLYAAHAYPRFIGRLIAHIPFSSAHAITSPEEEKHQQILKTLVFALENVIREAGFFAQTAEKWGLEIDGWRERRGTRDYTAEMARVAAEGLAPGLVFLWAMEKVYLDAWSSVNTRLVALSPTPSSAVHALAENWSTPQFVQFVDTLAALVDGLGIVPGSAEWRRAEEIWARVVELEAGFWPDEGDEDVMRISVSR